MRYNTKMKLGDYENFEGPNIFRAALNDDLYEMALAIQAGQSLADQDDVTFQTPLHLAVVRKSYHFIKAAVELDASIVKIRNANNLQPFDIARSRQDHRAMQLLYNAEFPEWPIEPSDLNSG